MTPGEAKAKPTDEEFDVGPCSNPVLGETRVEAYIAGQLTENANQSFVDHAAECEYCLQEIVLWRMAEELVDRDGRSQQVPHTA